jgi:hypothetical protein
MINGTKSELIARLILDNLTRKRINIHSYDLKY